MRKQRTLNKEVVFEGIGLHTGNLCRAVFRPAPDNHGVIFYRSDLPGRPGVKALCQNVLGVIRGTTLGNREVRVHTVEHMLSALYGLGIDNLEIELNANEPPVVDGSSRPFLDVLTAAGVSEQNADQPFYAPKSVIHYESESGESSLKIEPAEGLHISCALFYNHPQITHQHMEVTLTPESYLNDISPCRTFCFDYEVEALKKQGLARGGSLDNAVVIGLDRVHSKNNQLRFADEFVRHKILDLLGDLFLLGMPVEGRITAVRPGHGHNIHFVKKIYEAMLKESVHV